MQGLDFNQKMLQGQLIKQALQNQMQMQNVASVNQGALGNPLAQQVRNANKTVKHLQQIVKVTNTSGETQQAIIFDANGGFSLLRSQTNDPSLDFEWKTKKGSGANGYVYMLRKMVAGARFYIVGVNFSTDDENNYDNSITMYENIGNQTDFNERDNLFPSFYQNSAQQQTNLLETGKAFELHADLALVMDIEANSSITFKLIIEQEINTGR